MTLHPDFISELRKHFSGDIRTDAATRVLYSTDASIYQIEPLGAAIPKTQDDLIAAVELAAKYKIPILSRGSGSSLAGQAIGQALILDCSRYLDKLVEIDPQARTAKVEPGVILSTLNRAAVQYGLMFGPDPASAERATLGGVIGNNATGAHSILYGMAADHLLSADVILSDGSLATLGEMPISDTRYSNVDSRIAGIVSSAFEIREKYAETIKANWPRAWRNSAGYRLNYLLPWSATQPPQWVDGVYPPIAPGKINLAKLLAGSEGTLAVIRAATLNLVPKPKYTILGVLSYESVAVACDAVPGVLEHRPSAVELISQMLIRLARSVQAAAGQLGFVQGDPSTSSGRDPGALLVVEFSGDDPALLREKVRALGNVSGRGDVIVAESAAEQANVWAVRKMGLGIIDSRPTLVRPLAFIEDCAIPVERLGEFVREVERILAAHGVEAAFYAHASAGTLHIRPMLDLKTGEGARALRSIAEQVLALTLRVGGAMSSEHGDGLLRSEWLPQTYGAELVEAMKSLKRAADPDSILNPRNLTDAPPMDTHLRYGPAYRAQPWKPALDFSDRGGLARTVEQCNGQGVCRKLALSAGEGDTGVMCPSFQATREEQNSTRGRSNLLRALISMPLSQRERGWGEGERSVAAALDLCLACKGCTAECPSGVDMPKLKYEFFNEYHKTHARPLRDYLFGYFHVAAALLSPVAPLANAAMQNPLFKALAARVFDLAPQRSLPLFVGRAAQARVRRRGGRAAVILLSDVLSRYIEPQVEQAAFDALDLAGFDVHVLPVIGAGASLFSKGMIAPARRHAAHVLDELARLDPQAELPLVGIEPPELYMLKHDYTALLPARVDEIERRAEKTWLVEEWLVRSGALERWRALLGAGLETSAQPSAPLKLHPHCHQRAEGPVADGLPNGVDATVEMLRACGYTVEVLDTGCCGMAGTFGFDAEHYELSMHVGALQVFPQVKAAGDAGIVSTGAACRMQIAHGTGVKAEHPLVLAVKMLKGGNASLVE
jgi:FAD/FMN-containing dehydrogenase/Fe-S oxidoreductase